LDEGRRSGEAIHAAATPLAGRGWEPVWGWILAVPGRLGLGCKKEDAAKAEEAHDASLAKLHGGCTYDMVFGGRGSGKKSVTRSFGAKLPHTDPPKIPLPPTATPWPVAGFVFD
jgi:hypothetical protein